LLSRRDEVLLSRRDEVFCICIEALGAGGQLWLRPPCRILVRTTTITAADAAKQRSPILYPEWSIPSL